MKKFFLTAVALWAMISCQKPQYMTYVTFETTYRTINNVANPLGYNGPWECPDETIDSIAPRIELINNPDKDFSKWVTYMQNVHVTIRNTVNHTVSFFNRGAILSKVTRQIN